MRVQIYLVLSALFMLGVSASGQCARPEMLDRNAPAAMIIPLLLRACEMAVPFVH